MNDANRHTSSLNSMTQKVTGLMDWSDYIDFIDHIKRSRAGKGQMQFVGEAVAEKVAREKSVAEKTRIIPLERPQR